MRTRVFTRWRPPLWMLVVCLIVIAVLAARDPVIRQLVPAIPGIERLLPNRGDNAPSDPGADDSDQSDAESDDNPSDDQGTGGQPSGARPSAATTGRPQGLPGDKRKPVTLKDYDGPDVITKAHTLINGVRTGCLKIQAKDVIIRNSLIECDSDVSSVVVDDDSGSLTIEDTEVVSGSQNEAAVGYSNYTARRLDVHGGKDGFKITSNVIIESSFVHGLWLNPDDHADGAQQDGGGDHVTISGTYFNMVDPQKGDDKGHGGSYNAGVQVDKGRSSHFVIVGNWFSCRGSGYGINFRAHGGTGNRIEHNRFLDSCTDPVYTQGSVKVTDNKRE